MHNFKTRVDSSDSAEVFNFECYSNTESIEIGDYFLYFFAGIADVQQCYSEHEKSEINKNDRVKRDDIIDLVTSFWKNCYKIKTTNFDLTSIQ